MDDDVIAVLQLSYLPGLTYSGGWRAQIEGVRVARSHHQKAKAHPTRIERKQLVQCSMPGFLFEPRMRHAVAAILKLSEAAQW